MKSLFLLSRVSAGLLLVILVPGCQQFELSRIPDPCPSEERLTSEEVQRCWEKHEATLTSNHNFDDPDAKGRLRDEALPIAGRRLRHAVALDYSGSMFGGYDDDQPGVPPCGWHREGDRRIRNGPHFWENSDFVQFLADGPLGALTGAEQVHPLVFNRNVTLLGADGSFSTFDGARGFPAPLPAPVQGRDEVLALLSAIGSGSLPANPRDAPYGDPGQTRLPEVLDAASTLFESFVERDGILWIVTDNIIEQAPASSSEVVRDLRYNQQFYETLRDDPRWQVIHAWPIHEAPWLCSSTLMVYGLYYSSRLRIGEAGYRELCRGEEAQLSHDRQIRAFQRYANASSPSPGQPFKLKPHDIDVVEISFIGQVGCESVRVGVQGKCQAQIEIHNLLHHRRIDGAEIVLSNGRCDAWSLRSHRLWPVRIAPPFCSGTVSKTLVLQQPILPDRPERLIVDFQSPLVEMVQSTLADHWESASHERFLMLGRMDVGIRSLKTTMVIKEEALRDVYGVQDLPKVFRNPSTDNLQTSICLPLSVKNPSYLASLVLVTGLIFALLVAVLFLWLLKPSFRTLVIDGEDQGLYRLRRVGSQEVEHRGRRIGRVRLGWKGAPVLSGVAEHKIQKRGNTWLYHDPDGAERTIEIVGRAKAKTSKARSGDAF